MMNDGTLLSWTAGVWAPGVMESVAPDTARPVGCGSHAVVGIGQRRSA